MIQMSALTQSSQNYPPTISRKSAHYSVVHPTVTVYQSLYQRHFIIISSTEKCLTYFTADTPSFTAIGIHLIL